MKMKKDKLDSSESILAIDDEVAVENNKEKLQAYISECRAHLESLRDTIYKTLDAGLDNAELFRINEDSSIPYTEITPSSFLKKAYTVQEYDVKGKVVENRYQPYIKAGLVFTAFCEENGVSMSEEKQLLADAGKQTAAINAAISQLNRTESALKKEDYGTVFGLKDTIPNFIDTVLDAAKDSKIIQIIPNQTNVQKILSGIAELAKKIGAFFSNLGKSQTQQFKEQFNEMKANFKTEDSTHQPGPTKS